MPDIWCGSLRIGRDLRRGGEERRDCRQQFIAYMDTGGVRRWSGEGGDEKFG